MISETTAEAVKSAAMRIIMMPTGMLVFRPVRAEIQPLFGDRGRGEGVGLQDDITAYILCGSRQHFY